MIVYADTKAGFRQDVFRNVIANKIERKMRLRLGTRTGSSEIDSWRNSLQHMDRVIAGDEIPDDAGVAIEYRLPASSKRVDFILTGRDDAGQDTVVIVELKQWTEVQDSARPDIVRTRLGGSLRDTAHPSYQAWSYAALLADFNEEVYSAGVQVRPCAYLHNCADASVVRSAKFDELMQRAPVFISSEAGLLRAFLAGHVRKGDRGALLYRIENGRIRPSKQLADHLASLMAGNKDFVLIDDQKIVYEECLGRIARSRARAGTKEVVIVEGGPGTGKSVVAINLLAELVGQAQLNAAYVTRNAAPRDVFERKLSGALTKTRISALFQSSGRFQNTARDAFDALIIDEAHRLTEKSGFYGNEGENQILEAIRAARATVFFVDERQRVTVKDIGGRAEIERWARAEGAKVTHLQLASQFRCNGSDGYLAWLDNTLQIEETAHPLLDPSEFEFKVADSPVQLRRWIEAKNREGGGKHSRLVAGYCWPWTSKRDPSAMDIVIPEHGFEMQWNLDRHGSAWIIEPDSIREVGCIHTCQGLELDYVGVILGPDLVVRDGVVITDPNARDRYDKSVRGLKALIKEDPESGRALAASVIKNTYRTLMSRGLKGCYVWSVDEETNAWFRGRLGAQLDEAEAAPHPFVALAPEEAALSPRAVRLYDLSIAAGVFSGEQVAGEPEWIELPEPFSGGSDYFVARVDGESMNRRVPSGSWCLFRRMPRGSREGRVVLVQHASITDVEHRGRFTLKVYGSEVVRDRDGEQHKRVILRPDSTDPRFVPIVLEDLDDDSFQVLAEHVATF
ncbi:MAG: DNA/RNA helicase domain-containing protein [Planctomycetota bacterium]